MKAPSTLDQHELISSEQIEESSNNSKIFELNSLEFEQLIRAYKLSFGDQYWFNDLFGINERLFRNPSKENLKDFLEEKINDAFANHQKISNYYSRIEVVNRNSNRGIHGGFHVATVVFLAKNLLKIYQQNKDLFEEKTQQEISELEDPNKIRDLEILCLMHDVGRSNSNFDQDEYKNAFYVALMMRNIGDERFQGDKISEEGLKMIMDLAHKEAELKDKSLTSKLIQSADSVDIVRSKYFKENAIRFNFDLMNLYQDFNQIDYSYRTKKIIRMLQKIVSVNSRIGQFLPDLESLIEPMEMFLSSQKIQLLEELFKTEFKKFNQEEVSINFPTEEIGGHFIHVMKSGANPNSISPNKFICSTYIDGESTVLSYAERSWHSNPFLILDAKTLDGAVFLAGFKTDIASNNLLNIKGPFRNDIERIRRVVSSNNFDPKSYMTRLYPNLAIFNEKWDEVWKRRIGKIEDISDGEYFLENSTGNEILGKVGFEKYKGESYSKPHLEFRTPNGALRHNEVHLYASLHVMDYVGLTVDVFENGIDLRTPNSGSRIEAMSKLKTFKDSINYEKNRLKCLKDPLKDKVFKSCVELELSRVTSIMEKIYELQLMRDEICKNPVSNIYWIRAMQRKANKFSKSAGYIFTGSQSNMENWTNRKCIKIDEELQILRHDLRAFERSDNYGFQNLESIIDEVSSKKCCSMDRFEKRVLDWKKNILDGKSYPLQLQFAIDKVKKGLEKKTKMTLHDVFNSTKLRIVGDDEFFNQLSLIVDKNYSKEKVFKLFFENNDFESIFKLLSTQEIESIFTGYKQKYLKTEHNTFDEYVIDKKLDKCGKDELECLIKAGLNINVNKIVQSVKKNCQVEDFPSAFHKSFLSNNQPAVEVLLKWGVLIISPHKKSFFTSRSHYKSHGGAQNMFDFQDKLKLNDDKIISQLEKIIDEFRDVKDLDKTFHISFEKNGFLYGTTPKSIEINGHGIARIVEEKILLANERNLRIEKVFKEKAKLNPAEKITAPVALNALLTLCESRILA